MKQLATITLATLGYVGMLSSAMAADVTRPVGVVPLVERHPLLHPILWCGGGVIVSLAVDNLAPAIVGCTIGGVELVHHHLRQPSRL
jgi:hypothetical protein